MFKILTKPYTVKNNISYSFIYYLLVSVVKLNRKLFVIGYHELSVNPRIANNVDCLVHNLLQRHSVETLIGSHVSHTAHIGFADQRGQETVDPNLASEFVGQGLGESKKTSFGCTVDRGAINILASDTEYRRDIENGWIVFQLEQLFVGQFGKENGHHQVEVDGVLDILF